MRGADSRVDAGGVTWLITSDGPVAGDPVLFLHGFPEDRRSWRAQLPALARAGYRVHAADLPGIGGSTEPPSYRIEDVAPIVAALGRELGGPHLVGHDWGSILSGAASALDPPAFRSVTLSGGPHAAAFRVALRTPTQLARSWYVAAFLVPGAEFAVAAWRGAVSRLMFPVDAPVRTPAEARRALAYYRANFDPRRVARHRVARIRVPALVIHGDRDRYVGRRLMQETADRCDDLRAFEVLPAGHFVHQDLPDRFNDVLLRFLSSVDVRREPEAP